MNSMTFTLTMLSENMWNVFTYEIISIVFASSREDEMTIAAGVVEQARASLRKLRRGWICNEPGSQFFD